MANDDNISFSGIVESDAHDVFKVRLLIPNQKTETHYALCHLCGKMRKNNILVTVGDKVTVRLSPYDISKGIITYRER